MLLLPFFVTILIDAHLGHVAGEERVPILLLADFGTKVLGPVKTSCQGGGFLSPSLCTLVNALDAQFKGFGIKIIGHMPHSHILPTINGHSIFDTIQKRIKKEGLEMPKVMPDLKDDYHGFVTRVGQEILEIVGSTSGINAEIGETQHKNAGKETKWNDKGVMDFGQAKPLPYFPRGNFKYEI